MPQRYKSYLTISVVLVLFSILPVLSQNDSLFINPSVRGRSSFYANKFEGRSTSNGEIFSNKNLSAAHRTYPMNSIVRVTVVENNRYVFVRVNDRGPYAKGRIIDLTDAGATGLDFKHAGTEYVSVRLLEEIQLTPELRQRFNNKDFIHDCLGNTTTLKGKAILTGAFLSIEHALYIACDLYMDKRLHDIAVKVKQVGKQKRYMVIIHNLKSNDEVDNLIPVLNNRGLINAEKYIY